MTPTMTPAFPAGKWTRMYVKTHAQIQWSTYKQTHTHTHTHTYTHQGIPAHICVMTTHTKKYRKHTNTHSCHHTKEYELHTTHTCYHSTQNTTTYLKSFIAHWQARLYTTCTKYQGMPLRLIHCSFTLVGLSLHLQDICFPRVTMDTIQDTIANVTMPTV